MMKCCAGAPDACRTHARALKSRPGLDDWLVMEPPRNPSVLAGEGTERDLRRKGRLRCEMLVCAPLGQVVDLSGSGMRVTRRGGRICKPGQTVQVTLEHAEGHMQLKARVSWLRKTGFRRQEIGLEFIDMSPSLQSELARVARNANDCLTIAMRVGA